MYVYNFMFCAVVDSGPIETSGSSHDIIGSPVYLLSRTFKNTTSSATTKYFFLDLYLYALYALYTYRLDI